MFREQHEARTIKFLKRRTPIVGCVSGAPLGQSNHLLNPRRLRVVDLALLEEGHGQLIHNEPSPILTAKAIHRKEWTEATTLYANLRLILNMRAAMKLQHKFLVSKDTRNFWRDPELCLQLILAGRMLR